MKAKILVLFLVSSMSMMSAHAREELTIEFKEEIAEDLQKNFAEKISDLAGTVEENESPLSAKDQKVILRALYAGIQGPLSLAGVQIGEQNFYSKVGGLLLQSSRYGLLPAAITIGWFKRADLVVGKTVGTEMNFYLDQGKLKVSTYDLKTLNVGISASAKIGYYVALCFGVCTGGDAEGTYVGVDADVIFGAGANVYVEVGVDTTDLYKAKKLGESYALSELYEARTIYIGAGIDLGVGGGFSMGFTNYNMTSDVEIMDLYSMVNQPQFGARVRANFDRLKLFKSAPRLH